MSEDQLTGNLVDEGRNKLRVLERVRAAMGGVGVSVRDRVAALSSSPADAASALLADSTTRGLAISAATSESVSMGDDL